MTLLGTRRAADELSRALDGDDAARSAGTAPLAALGERLRGAGAELDAVTLPREDFRAALRTRLVAVASVQPVAVQPVTAAQQATARPGLSRAQRAFGVAAGALASAVAVSGVAVASTQSLPGDPFYGVKRTAEAVQLELAGDGVEQGDRHLQFAATRLDEVRELALGRDVQPAGGARAAADVDWERVRETLADMDDQTRRGSALLERAWSDDRDRQALALLSGFAAAQAAELEALLPVMAAEVRGDAEASLGLVSQVAATTSQLADLVPCTEACASGGTSTGAGGDCECDSAPSPSTRPSASPSTAPSAPPSSAPTPSGSAPPPAPAPPGTPGSEPTAGPPSGPRTPSEPLPPVLTVPPAPTRLPPPLQTPLPSGLPTVTPALPLDPTPVPSLDPVPDVLPG